MSKSHKPYSCPECTASCTFEAMQMCQNANRCPVILSLETGVIVDRRPDDLHPDFPTEFTYAEADVPAAEAPQ